MSLWKQIWRCNHGLLAMSRFAVASQQTCRNEHTPTPTCAGLGKDDCVDDHPKARDPKTIKQTFPFYNLIKFGAECADCDCIDNDFPFFDKCLYKESDKNTRKYQVTWTECPPVAIKPKKICCFEKIKRPPIIRRGKKKPQTACEQPKCSSLSGDLGCPKITSPGCRPVRIPVRCSRLREPADCVKIKAPYPAFSECSRPKLRLRRRTECECWHETAQCELFAILNKRERSGNTSLSPCDRKAGK